jgi:hypothetical protein
MYWYRLQIKWGFKKCNLEENTLQSLESCGENGTLRESQESAFLNFHPNVQIGHFSTYPTMPERLIKSLLLPDNYYTS